MLKMPTCNADEEDEVLKIFLGDTFPSTDCECLDPCSQDKYTFKVKISLCYKKSLKAYSRDA